MSEFTEIIKARIDRFNRLWNLAVGYSFEESDRIRKEEYEKLLSAWQPLADKKAIDFGFDSFNDYLDGRILDDTYEKIPELEKLYEERPRNKGGLYSYEMSVIDEAERIAIFITNKSKKLNMDTHIVWDKYAKNGDEYVGCFTFVDNIVNDGYKGWFEGKCKTKGCKILVQKWYESLY